MPAAALEHEPVLRVDGLGRAVPTPQGTRWLLRDVSFDLQAGRVLGVVGPSGSGKTTLLRLLCALDEPTTATLTCQGKPYAEWTPTSLRRTVALVSQVPTVFEGNGWDNLWLPANLAGTPTQAVSDRLAPVLPLLGLDEHLLAQPAATLSVGQQQRLCLARALGTDPAVLLLDEPTASLDPNAAEHLLAALANYCQQAGRAIAFVTHQLDQVEALADAVLLVASGRQLVLQPTAEFLEQPSTEEAADFVAAARHTRPPEPAEAAPTP